MGNFQLLSREQEVEIAKRIEAGEKEVEEEVLSSPVTLDFLIRPGRPDRGRRGRPARHLRGKRRARRSRRRARARSQREAAQKAARLHEKAQGPARQARRAGRGIARAARPAAQAQARAQLRADARAGQGGVHDDGTCRGTCARRLSPRCAISSSSSARRYQTSQHYEDATGRSKTQLIKEAAEAEDRRHVLKVNGTRENLLDIAARIREAQRTMKAVERRVKATARNSAARSKLSRPGSTRAGAPRRN